MSNSIPSLHVKPLVFIVSLMMLLLFVPAAYADEVACDACGNTGDESTMTNASGYYICEDCLAEIAGEVGGTASDSDIVIAIEDWLYMTSSSLAAAITADLLFEAVKALIITTYTTDGGALIWTYNSFTRELWVQVDEDKGSICGQGFYKDGRLILCMQCGRYFGSETENYSILTDYSRMIVCNSCGTVLNVFA